MSHWFLFVDMEIYGFAWCMCTGVCLWMDVCLPVCWYVLCVYECVSRYECAHVYVICLWLHTYLHAWMHVCMCDRVGKRLRMCACMLVCMYTRLLTGKHSQSASLSVSKTRSLTHTHTHTHTLSLTHSRLLTRLTYTLSRFSLNHLKYWLLTGWLIDICFNHSCTQSPTTHSNTLTLSLTHTTIHSLYPFPFCKRSLHSLTFHLPITLICLHSFLLKNLTDWPLTRCLADLYASRTQSPNIRILPRSLTHSLTLIIVHYQSSWFTLPFPICKRPEHSSLLHLPISHSLTHSLTHSFHFYLHVWHTSYPVSYWNTL